ncbi:RPM1 interacting protein 13 isoform X1 [Diospyros lotus]|uniref:RPM1 interacting protein 13 isoform X1 n=1 Tax=Diospyros lotus TaxID=55363 RepID=UPI00225A08D9|nr:RPM1 interacting protein 13 isoform X1 [Diospyros lotus]
MDLRPVVHEISSDEEDWSKIRRGGDDDLDWISKLFEKPREADDSDDVVLLREVVLNPKPRSKPSSFDQKPPAKDSDDECVVLDGDPDKPVVVQNSSADDSDELLIVGEKGQIACRDYPHSRHLCAKFPFASTLHERHCPQCHCYVCDSLAPCLHWGNGTSNTDHCHATDKDEFWKLQRENLRQGIKPIQSAPKFPDISASVGPFQTIQVPPAGQLPPNSLVQLQDSGPTAIRACSASANFGIRNITNQGRGQQSACNLSRSKSQSHMVPQHLLSPRNTIIRRDRRHPVGNFGRPFVNAHSNFQRAGPANIAVQANRSEYGSANYPLAHYSGNSSPVEAPNNKNPTRYQGLCSRVVTSNSSPYQVPAHQNTASNFVNSHGFQNSFPSQPQVSSQPNTGSNFVNSVPSLQACSPPNMCSGSQNSWPSQVQVSSQPTLSCSFVDSVPSLQASLQPIPSIDFETVHCQPQEFSQPSMDSSFVHPVPSQPQVFSQPSMGNDSAHLVPSQLQVFSQPNMSSYPIHLTPPQPQGCSLPAPSLNDCHDGSQQGNGAQNPLNPSSLDFPTSWFPYAGQSNPQILGQSTELTYHPPLAPQFDTQTAATANPGSPASQLDNWLQGIPSFIDPSDPPPLDSGFFDFENS